MLMKGINLNNGKTCKQVSTRHIMIKFMYSIVLTCVLIITLDTNIHDLYIKPVKSR